MIMTSIRGLQSAKLRHAKAEVAELQRGMPIFSAEKT